jgi:hypothetical protein
MAAAFIGGLGITAQGLTPHDAERYPAKANMPINRIFAPEAWQRFIGSGTACRMILVVRYFREHHLAFFHARGRAGSVNWRSPISA